MEMNEIYSSSSRRQSHRPQESLSFGGREPRPFSPAYPPSSYAPPMSPLSPSSAGGRALAMDSTSSTAHLNNHYGNFNTTAPASGLGGPAHSNTFSRAGLNDAVERRRETLARIDNADFGWFHVRACMVAGVGFFTDAYDLFAINLVSPMLGYVYFSHNGNAVPADIDLGLKVAASIGTFFGQIGFGYLADKLGRKKMYGVELMIIIVATFGQALCGTAYALSLPTAIIIWRFILGIGVGGDYPLSAVITSEFATTNRRGAMMAAVFAMQGFGYLTTGIVAIVLLLAFRPMIDANPQNLDYVWRCLIGLGCVPALVAVYFRLTIPETPRYVMDVENNLNKAEADVNMVLKTRNALQSHRDSSEDRRYDQRKNSSTAKGGPYNALTGPYDNRNSHLANAKGPSILEFCQYFSKWVNFKVLMGTSMTWFALDVAFYGIGLNNTFILSTVHFGTESANDPWHTMWNATVGQVIIVLLGAIPGYWVTVFTIERLGRIKIQVIGFVMSCILFCTLGFAYYPIRNLSPVLFVFLFALTQFFQNFGPNATTFIIPGEVFPTRYRSTAHGISAGMGKLGAIAAQVGFSRLKDQGGKNAFIPQLLQIFALFMFIGLLFTYFVPETKGKTLEELSGEDDYASRKMERERPYAHALYEDKDEDRD